MRLLSIVIAVLISWSLLLDNVTFSYTHCSVNRTIKYRGIVWYLLYKLSDMPDEAYIIKYEHRSVKAY